MWKTLTEGHIKLFSSLFPDGFEPVPSSPLNTALRDNFARDITYNLYRVQNYHCNINIHSDSEDIGYFGLSLQYIGDDKGQFE